MYLNYCRILGVDPGSDMAALKQAFRKKAKLYHPDINPLPEANLEFIKIKKAFDYLLRCSTINTASKLNNRSSGKNYYNASEFDWEKYRQWQQACFQHRKKSEEVDFKSTLFGKSVFYFFHMVFLFAGVSIIASPILTIISYGFDPEKSIAVTLVVSGFVSLFGFMMVLMILFSVMNQKFPNRFFIRLFHNIRKYISILAQVCRDRMILSFKEKI